MDCDMYFESIPTVAFDPINELEKKLPLAYGHSVHADIGILEMYLAMHFRYVKRLYQWGYRNQLNVVIKM